MIPPLETKSAAFQCPNCGEEVVFQQNGERWHYYGHRYQLLAACICGTDFEMTVVSKEENPPKTVEKNP